MTFRQLQFLKIFRHFTPCRWKLRHKQSPVQNWRGDGGCCWGISRAVSGNVFSISIKKGNTIIAAWKWRWLLSESVFWGSCSGRHIQSLNPHSHTPQIGQQRKMGRVSCIEFQWDLLQSHAKEIQWQKTEMNAVSWVKYGVRVQNGLQAQGR